MLGVIASAGLFEPVRVDTARDVVRRGRPERGEKPLLDFVWRRPRGHHGIVSAREPLSKRSGLPEKTKPARSPSPAMYLILSKKPRKSNRTKTGRYRAKLKAKDRGRRSRVYQAHRRT